MTRIYRWLLRSFALVLLIFIIVQAFLLILGLRLAINMYNVQSNRLLEETVKRILVNPEDPDIPRLEYSMPLFVFRADGSLLYTNRGQGRAIEESLMNPVDFEGTTIGYWYAAENDFRDRQENRIFLLAVSIMAAVSLVISALLASLGAWFSAKRLSGYFAGIQADIGAIDGSTVIPARSFPIAELDDISRKITDISTRLKEEEQYKQQWMQDLAHDLRTPIAGVKSQLEAMRDGVLPPDAERLSRNLLEIEKLEVMVEDINSLTMIENRGRLELAACDGRVIAGILRERFSRRMQQAELELRCSSDIHMPFQADIQLLMRALSNLLENALSYSMAGTLVEFSISGAEHQKVLMQTRNMPASTVDEDPGRWFQRFHRGDYSRASRGVGLGLNIAREIFRRHGGGLEVALLEDGRIEFNGWMHPAPLEPEPLKG